MGTIATRLSYTVLLLSMCVIVTGCGSTAEQIEANQTHTDEPLEYMDFINQTRTPEDLFIYYRHYGFVYRSDPIDGSGEFRPPQVTYELGYGDCDDFALLSATVLQAHGITCNVISIYDEDGYGHALCVFKGGWTSNYHVGYGNTDDLEKFLDTVHAWTVFSVYPENQARNREHYDINKYDKIKR